MSSDAISAANGAADDSPAADELVTEAITVARSGAASDADRALTIAEAAVAFGTGRRFIRTKLYAGEFRNATKDEQGFWRIPESDLLAAGMCIAQAASPSGSTPRDAAGAATRADTGELVLLRLEVLDLRHRVERAEELLETERKLSEERARALDNERVTVDALYRQLGTTRPVPKPPDAPKVDWKANMRAARERDLQMRAAREREARQSAGRRETAPPAGVPAPSDPVAVGARNTDNGRSTETLDASSAPRDPDRRHRWRRR